MSSKCFWQRPKTWPRSFGYSPVTFATSCNSFAQLGVSRFVRQNEVLDECVTSFEVRRNHQSASICLNVINKILQHPPVNCRGPCTKPLPFPVASEACTCAYKHGLPSDSFAQHALASGRRTGLSRRQRKYGRRGSEQLFVRCFHQNGHGVDKQRETYQPHACEGLRSLELPRRT